MIFFNFTYFFKRESSFKQYIHSIKSNDGRTQYIGNGNDPLLPIKKKKLYLL